MRAHEARGVGDVRFDPRQRGQHRRIFRLIRVLPQADAEGMQQLALAGVVTRLHERMPVGRQRRRRQREVGPLHIRVQVIVGIMRIV